MFHISPFSNGRNDDGRDENRDAFQFSIAFGQDADGGKFIFTESVGEEIEAPAEDDDIGGGERERQFLRRHSLVILGIRIGVERVINQLAGVETTAMMFIFVKLNAGGIGDGGLVTTIIKEGGHIFWG